MARKPSLRIVTVVIKTIATEERDGVHLQIQQEQMGTYSQQAGLGWGSAVEDFRDDTPKEGGLFLNRCNGMAAEGGQVTRYQGRGGFSLN